MCGIVAIIGNELNKDRIAEVIGSLSHRGPDAEGVWLSRTSKCVLAHRRLSIIDLSEDGNQPMCSDMNRYCIILNGEIYNYLEIKEELKDNYDFRTQTDTEVLLAAFQRWGISCFDRLIGMFACVIWDEQTQTAIAVRDRFGVKPLYYTQLPGGELAISSEIKIFHELGLPRDTDVSTWATYLTYGFYDNSERTFWNGVQSLPPGHYLTIDNKISVNKWYDLRDRIRQSETRNEDEVMNEYCNMLEESVNLRFRSDVSVGINLSGGLDSSILLGLAQKNQSDVDAFTFITGEPLYDELPWVQQMLEGYPNPHHVCMLEANEVPSLAAKVQKNQDEPFGGLPTLGYAKIFERARDIGVKVLLDGQGMDEQWAGYDYYYSALSENLHASNKLPIVPLQGCSTKPIRPECLIPDFRDNAVYFMPPSLPSDALTNLQCWDIRYSKLPKALRFNDRVSMMYSIELREPFLDHRLFEIALNQPIERKIQNGINKWLLRRIAKELLPSRIVNASKRPLQVAQIEWFKGHLKNWVESMIEVALEQYGDVWLDVKSVRREWNQFVNTQTDNSFYIWQWVSIGLFHECFLRSK